MYDFSLSSFPLHFDQYNAPFPCTNHGFSVFSGVIFPRVFVLQLYLTQMCALPYTTTQITRHPLKPSDSKQLTQQYTN